MYLDSDTEKIAFSALLHDIGKFWQRTGEKPLGYEDFTEKDYGLHGAHAKWSAAFVERFIPNKDWVDRWAILTHHNPKNRISKLIAVADWLSAGERREEEQKQPIYLRSIFDSIELSLKPPGEKFYYPLKPLSLKKEANNWELFPKPNFSEGSYDSLWKQFTEEIEKLNRLKLSSSNYLETLFYLLKKYTWCIPSAYYRSIPDVSLFDHSRITAAIAICLQKDRISEDQLDELLKGLREKSSILQKPIFLLIGGDISGVQDFIYTITSAGAAKGLRGRSFYLELLNEAVSRYLLRNLGLSVLNLIYLGGGNFYFIAPLSVRERFYELKREVSEKILKLHKGDLYFALGEVEITPGDLITSEEFKTSTWAMKIDELFEKLNQTKNSRFMELDKDSFFENILQPVGEGGEPEKDGKPKFCQICQEEGDIEEEEGIRKCSLCKSFEELGEDIVKANWLVFKEVNPVSPDQETIGYKNALKSFGIEVKFPAKIEEIEESFSGVALKVVDYKSNEANFIIFAKKKLDIAYGFEFYPKVTPLITIKENNKEEKRIATFNEIASKSQGIKRLGILRMDVDNLGKIFREGLGWRTSASRLATVSFMLSSFFKGWLGLICQEFNNSGKGLVYLTYSGGDDLFLVGSWNLMPEIAKRIKEDFEKFTCRNPNLSISAGITIVPEKFPVYKAAQLAKYALDDQAKKVSRKKDGVLIEKSAISFFGQPLGWEEFEIAEKLKSDLYELIKNGVPRGFLSRLFTIYSLYARNEQEKVFELLKPEVSLEDYKKRIFYEKWLWRLVYHLSRFKVFYKNQERLLEELQKKLIEEKWISLLGFASRWVEFLTRKTDYLED